MSFLTRRLIGLAAALGTLAYVAITHSAALKTYLEDRKKAEEDSAGKSKDAES
ncbi:MAG: hypothetical protein J6S26_05330 [Solobacterium sp.]|nr:hypothetical protein [Solobacterium sp.]